jgi:hypothetical protein
MDLAALQTKVDEITAAAARETDVDASAVTLLNSLGAAFLSHVNDPAAIEALATAMTNATGSLNSSADTLAAAITANTPAA